VYHPKFRYWIKGPCLCLVKRASMRCEWIYASTAQFGGKNEKQFQNSISFRYERLRISFILATKAALKPLLHIHIFRDVMSN
jgi:hypothetical protein